MADDPYLSVVGLPRSSSPAGPNVMEVKTYDQLEEHLASFLASNEQKLLRTAVQRGSGWSIGVPSAVRRAAEAIDPSRRARLGKVICVKLPCERRRGWTLRTVQRKVAEGVLGVDATKELMDGTDEDDDYSGVRAEDRGVIEGVSRRISQELSRIRRFLLVIENWWEKYSPVLEGLGIPLPSRWSPQGAKVILWDPIFVREEGEMTPLGEPTANVWLSLHRPTTTHVYREAVDLAEVLNGDGQVDHAAITTQVVLDCLLFTSLLCTSQWMVDSPLRQSKSELVQLWVQNGLLSAGPRAAASEDEDDRLIATAAAALLEELLHRRMLLLYYARDVEVIDMLGNLRNSLWDFATSADAPQGYDGFLPRKVVVWRGSECCCADLKEPENVEWISLVNEGGSQVTLDDVLLVDDGGGGGPQNANLCNLQTLVLHRLPSLSADVFSKMVSLRVLVITSAMVSSLPSSVFGLPNLRVLLLRDCKSLTTFFVPGAPPRALHGLRVLDLSRSTIPDFPDQAFSHLHNIEELLLRGCSKLKAVGENILGISSNFLVPPFLPAPNLKRLLLSDCSHLKTLTPHLYSHSALEELDLRSCHALQVEEIEFKMPMLKLIHLSGSPAIRRLSFRGCGKLVEAELYELQNLESLDLSGTAIKELDLRSFPSKSLIFLGASSLRIFPWKMMQHYSPEELILDQHIVEANNCNKDSMLTHGQSHGGRRGVWMHVRDGRFFRMLCDPDKGTYSQLGSPFARPFYINIAPPVKQGKKVCNKGELARRAPLHYRGIQVQPNIFLQKQSSLCRHVEIQGSHASPRDIHGFLENTLSLSVSDEHTYRSLSELTPMDSALKQCQIEKCHGMETIFESSADSCLLQSLESVWASELRNVEALVVEKGRGFDWSQGFKNLKHVHLESCSRLRYIFPQGARQGLQSLEVLEILFCPNLKEVFAPPSQESQQPMSSSSSPTLPFAPRLRILHLLQLPSLSSICHATDTHWPALETFKVRGCWRLQKLPFLADNKSTRIVMIDGEPPWWNKLVQGGGIIAKHEFHPSKIDLPLPMPKK